MGQIVDYEAIEDGYVLAVTGGRWVAVNTYKRAEGRALRLPLCRKLRQFFARRAGKFHLLSGDQKRADAPDDRFYFGHNSPLHRWAQPDYFEMAAFNRVMQENGLTEMVYTH